MKLIVIIFQMSSNPMDKLKKMYKALNEITIKIGEKTNCKFTNEFKETRI